MLLHTLVAILCVGQTGSANWAGSITCTMDRDVVLTRDGRDYRAIQSSAVRTGDLLRTGAAGGAAFLLDNQAMVYLAGNTILRLDGAGDSRQLTLIEGETRVTAKGPHPIRITTRAGNVIMRRGIVRMATSTGGTRLRAEQGEVQLLLSGRVEQKLQAGQEVNLSGRNGSLAHAWSIKPAAFQLASLPSMSNAEQAARGGGEQARQADERGPVQEQMPPEEEDQQRAAEEEAAAAERGLPAETEATVQGAVPDVSAFTTGAGSALGLGGISGSSFASASGGLFSDAQQQTFQGMLTEGYGLLAENAPFPGNIHLVTGETSFQFGDVHLTPSEQAAFAPGGNPAYYSIANGAPTQTQVVTDVATASGAPPVTIPVTNPAGGASNQYLVRFDQFGVPDSTLDPQAAALSNFGIAGLVEPPTAPTITGADPLLDDRGKINERATFALGEIRLRVDGDRPEIAIRESDQDRRIAKDPNNNDALDQVTVNSDVTEFIDVPDPRFLPQVPTVKVPKAGKYDTQRTYYSNLDPARRAAVTTVLADRLYDYAHRTGQTRFVLTDPNGAQRIVDITGYRRPQP